MIQVLDYRLNDLSFHTNSTATHMRAFTCLHLVANSQTSDKSPSHSSQSLEKRDGTLPKSRTAANGIKNSYLALIASGFEVLKT
jgi:hypothetical protein